MKPLTSPILAKRFNLSSVQQAMPHSVFPTSFSPSTSARHTPSGQLLYNMPLASPGASSLSGSSSASTVSSSSSSLLQHNLSSSSSSNSLPPSESPTPDPDSILSDQLWLSQFYLGISHLHNSLPEFFLPHITPAFPPEIYDPHVSLTLLPPVSLHLSSLRLYSLFFGAARTSLALALKDPWVRIERVTVIPPGEGDGWAGGLKETVDRESSVEAGGEKGEGGLSKVRIDRKVRVRCVVGGRLRLPLQVEGGLLGGGEGVDREWTISNLYSFSPLSARITHHLVETVHPAPGEGAGAWLSIWRGTTTQSTNSTGGGCLSATEIGEGRSEAHGRASADEFGAGSGRWTT